MVERYCLTSIWLKIVCIIVSAFLSSLLVLFIVLDLALIYIGAISVLLSLLLLSLYLICNHKIVIKNDEIIFGNLKLHRRKIMDIRMIRFVGDCLVKPKGTCYIELIFSDNSRYSILGYEGFFKKDYSKLTKDIMENIKKSLYFINHKLIID